MAAFFYCIRLLIVRCVNLEIALRMLADRSHFRSLLSDYDMAAVCTFPNHVLVA